ncbi:MAG: cytochrome c3 family protein [Proteobacteria bacterium]|nr:cytochrome c3 family protein [Pseudomonadota bacterium]
MRGKYIVCTNIFIISAFLLCPSGLSFAQTKAPAEPLTIGVEGGKLPPVTFSHKTHTEKSKIDCAVCHHKDDNPKEPQGCLKCHSVKVTGNNAPAAKMVFHKMCITCHKESLTKGIKAPVQCIECHRK